MPGLARSGRQGLVDGTDEIGVQRLIDRVAQAVFGQPIVTNVFRSLLVEAMVAEALGADWRWCSADFSLWDFEHVSGVKLEVKQSAARQIWSKPGARPSRAVFDIAHRQGGWDDGVWVPGRTRHADLYVLAHHPIADTSADHRRADQWRFYVVRARDLPDSRSVSLKRLEHLASPLPATALSGAVAELLETL